MGRYQEKGNMVNTHGKNIENRTTHFILLNCGVREESNIIMHIKVKKRS